MTPRRLSQSFSYALEGAYYVWRTQRNIRIHSLLGYIAITLSFVLEIQSMERSLLLVVIAGVLIIELLNTAIEAAVDIHVTGYHPLAKTAKNVAAGAVLVAAVLSVLIGIEIFVPRLHGLQDALTAFVGARPGLSALWLLGAFALLVEVFKTRKGGP